MSGDLTPEVRQIGVGMWEWRVTNGPCPACSSDGWITTGYADAERRQPLLKPCSTCRPGTASTHGASHYRLDAPSAPTAVAEDAAAMNAEVAGRYGPAVHGPAVAPPGDTPAGVVPVANVERRAA